MAKQVNARMDSYGVRFCSGLGGPSYTKGYAEVGQTYYYNDSGAVNTTYTYALWGDPVGISVPPWRDGVTVSNLRVTVSVGRAKVAGYLAGVPDNAMVSVCKVDREPEGDYATDYAYMMSLPEYTEIQTDKATTITFTNPADIENVLRYGLVFRAKTDGWNASVYVTITYDYEDIYEAADIAITSCPERAYLNDDITISWNYSQSANVEQYAVDAELYNVEGDFGYPLATLQVTAENACTVNLRSISDALESAGVWALRVRVYTQGGSVVSAWSVSNTLELVNIAVAIVSPKDGASRIAAEPLRLCWRKSAEDSLAGDPYGFTVQYSEDAGESWKTVLDGVAAQEETGWYAEVPGNMFPHGIIQWRVRARTTQYQTGAFTKGSFMAVVQASTSAVSCDNMPMPTLSWSSSSQTAYQVRFADYDSGAVFGSKTQHTVPYVYEDGLYAVQMRTQTTTGEWSDWTELQYVEIVNTPPSGAVSVAAEKRKRSVEISWEASGEFVGYILYREGTPIYAGTAARYNDLDANGKNTYFVRAVASSGYYDQSAEIVADGTPDTDCLYDYSGNRWISLQYSAVPRQRAFTKTKRTVFKYYSGRSRPVAYKENFTERKGSFNYCFREKAEADTIETLAGKNVLYKGKDGSVIYGVLNDVGITKTIVWDVSFAITEIHREVSAAYAVT